MKVEYHRCDFCGKVIDSLDDYDIEILREFTIFHRGVSRNIHQGLYDGAYKEPYQLEFCDNNCLVNYIQQELEEAKIHD
jgi:hypothetical protein